MTQPFWPDLTVEERCRKCPTITGFKVGLVDDVGRPTETSPVCPVHYALLIVFLRMRQCPGCRQLSQTLQAALHGESDPGHPVWFRRETIYMVLHVPGCNAMDVFMGRAGL